MKLTSVYHTACGILLSAVVSMTSVNQVQADGTEQLGLPSIPIAPGSGIYVQGTGLYNAQPGEIVVEIPANVSIAQVLLYWSGRSVRTGDDPGDISTIQVNGIDVTGPRIGGPTLPPNHLPSHAYRSDITELSALLGWLQTGQSNLLSVGGLDFAYSNDGAAVVIIWDDGTITDLQIVDGNDWAYSYHGAETVPVDFVFEPSNNPRTGYMWLLISDVDAPRPAAIDLTVDGLTTRMFDILKDNEGDFLQVIELEVPVPAGVTNATVQVLSTADDSGLNPASLAWTFASWEITPPKKERGCTYTQGFWKNHASQWPTDNLSLFNKRNARRLLGTPPKRGNAYLILVHQYIAAELNVVNGASIPDDVQEAWWTAQEILELYQNEESIPKNSPDRATAIALAGILDDYNNGRIGPGHCDSSNECNISPQQLDSTSESEDKSADKKKKKAKK